MGLLNYLIIQARLGNSKKIVTLEDRQELGKRFKTYNLRRGSEIKSAEGYFGKLTRKNGIVDLYHSKKDSNYYLLTEGFIRPSQL